MCLVVLILVKACMIPYFRVHVYVLFILPCLSACLLAFVHNVRMYVRAYFTRCARSVEVRVRAYACVRVPRDKCVSHHVILASISVSIALITN